MGQILPELTYNNKVLLPIGRPVDDLKALYAKKDADYNYVIDNLNKTETALNQIPFHEKDRNVVDKAKGVFRETFNQFEEEGDFENKIIDTKRLANDLVNRHGLMEVQRIAQNRQGLISGLKERFDKGEISSKDFQRAIRDADTNYKGVQFDETTGTYMGNYNMRNVLPKINFSEKVADVLKGFKESTLILTDPNGRQIVSDPNGSGYMIAGTRESVEEEDLIYAAKNYLANDPDFKDRVADDLYYETQSLLQDPITGERREMTVDDLKQLVGTSVTKDMANKLGLENMNNLQQALESRGLSVEDVYRNIRGEQMANGALALGVEKESYEKYSAKYLQDWIHKLRLDSGGSPLGQIDYGILRSFNTEQRTTKQDLERQSNLYNQSVDDLEVATAKLAEMENDYAANKENVHPNDIKRKREQINTLKRTIALSNNNLHNIIQASPEIIQKVQGLKEPITSTAYGREYTATPKFNINNGASNRLLMRAVSSPLQAEDLRPYMTFDRNEYYSDNIINSLSIDDIKNLSEQFPNFINPEIRNTLLAGEETAHLVNYPDLHDTLKNMVKGQGENALRSLNLTEDTKGKLRSGYEQNAEMFTRNKASQINDIAKDLKNKVDKQDVDYTKEYKSWNLPEMEAKDRRNNPLYQLDYMATNLSEDINIHTQLSSTFDDLDIKTYIQENFDVEDEDNEIFWDSGKLQPYMDLEYSEKTNQYEPILKYQIDIKEGKEKKTISVPVHYPEPSYRDKFTEALNTFRKGLLDKARTGQLKPSEQKSLDRANVSLYNLTRFGSEFDLLNLYTAKNGDQLPFEFWDGKKVDVKVFENDSPQNLSYYLVKEEGEKLKYHAVDSKGQHALVSSEELANSREYTALGGDTPEDVKTLLSSMVFNNNDTLQPQQFNVDLQNTIDLNQYFPNDIKEGVIPRIHNSLELPVRNLKNEYPSLIITDAVRPSNASYGSPTSEHKSAKALDFRLNDPVTGKLNIDAYNLSNLSQSELNSMGIKSAEIHDDNHVHVVFL